MACADADGERRCGPGRRLLVAGGSSFGLIDAAQTRRELTEDEAILLKLRAGFGDPALPRRWRGDGSALDSTATLAVAERRLGAMPARLRRQVEPYLRPPAFSGSFADPATGDEAAAAGLERCELLTRIWRSVPAVGGKARIWYRLNVRGDVAKAEALAGELSGTIWPSLTGLMGPGHDPLPDTGFECNPRLGPEITSPEDPALDVYLWPLGAGNGATKAHRSERFACPASPAYVVIDPGRPRTSTARGNGAARTVLAHELMHVLIDTFSLHGNCEDWGYLNEAVATWAEDHTYRGDQSELAFPQMLGDASHNFRLSNYLLGYRGWPFLYSVEKHSGAAPVKAVYDQGSGKDPYDALSSGLPGTAGAAKPDGLDRAWTRFAAEGWNRPLPPAGLTESFFSESWERWSATPKTERLQYALSGSESTENLPLRLRGLGRQYADIGFRDRRAKYISFQNMAPTDDDKLLRVQAFVEIADQGWRLEDWSNKEKPHEFCRDKKDQNVQNVVVVWSTTAKPRGDREVTKSDKPLVRLEEECRKPVGWRLRYYGKGDSTTGSKCPPSSSAGGYTVSHVEWDLTWEPFSSSPSGGGHTEQYDRYDNSGQQTSSESFTRNHDHGTPQTWIAEPNEPDDPPPYRYNVRPVALDAAGETPGSPISLDENLFRASAAHSFGVSGSQNNTKAQGECTQLDEWSWSGTVSVEPLGSSGSPGAVGKTAGRALR